MRKDYEQLAAKATAGDSTALNALVEDCYQDLYYFALKTVKNADLAYDVTQDSVIEIMTTIGNLREPAAFPTWVRMIVYHQCTKHFKEKKEVVVDENEDGETIFDRLPDDDSSSMPEEVLEDKEFKNTILTILDSLPAEQRAAMMLYYYEHRSVSEIAQIEGVSEGTIKSRLNYGRKAVKAKVEDYEKKTGVRLHSAAFLPLLMELLYKNDYASTPTASFTLPTAAASVEAAASGGAAESAANAATASAASSAGTVSGTAAAAGTAGAGAAGAAGLALAAKIAIGIGAAALIGGGFFGVTKLATKETPAAEPTAIVETSDLPAFETVTGIEPTVSEGLIFKLIEDDTAYCVFSGRQCKDADLTVPGTYKGKPVKEIGNESFAYNENLKNLSIGENVIAVNPEAFALCTNLQSVVSPDSLVKIGHQSFGGCTNLTSLTIGQNVTLIEYEAFAECTALKTVYYGGTAAQWADITIEKGNDPLLNATLICAGSDDTPTVETTEETPAESTVTAVETPTSLDPSVEPTVSKGLEMRLINNETEYEVAGIGTCTDVNIVIPDTYEGKPVTAIGKKAFNNFHIGPADEELEEMPTLHIKSVIIPDNVRTIGDDAFSGSYDLISITLGTGIISIGNSCFSNCEKLTSIMLPSSLQTIGKSAFAGCENLTSITVPKGVETIGRYAFFGCDKLESAIISESVKNIGYEAFASCKSLSSLTVSSNNITYHSDGNCIIETESKTLIIGCKDSVIPADGSVTAIGPLSFEGASMTEIVIPEGITMIDEGAFFDCKNLLRVTIPATVTKLVMNPFTQCVNLSAITVINDNEKYHSDGNCIIETESKTLIIGCKDSIITADGSVTTIGIYAFNKCTKMTSISIPDDIKTIEIYAFSECYSLETVYYGGSKEKWSEISILGGNDSLNNAEIVFLSN